jgi:hypothetical protein
MDDKERMQEIPEDQERGEDLDEDEEPRKGEGEADADPNLSLRHRLHSEHCKLAQEAIRSSSDEYDKNLLKLSTLFLGLSLTFMKDIVHVDKLTHIYSLYFSWCLFGLTVLAVIVSFQLSVQANIGHLAVLDDYYLEGNLTALNRSNKWNTAVIIVNLSAGVFFILGIASSVYFVIFNFGGK